MSSSLRAELALEMATWSRRTADLGRTRPPQRSGCVRYLAIRYTEPSADEGAVTSVGSKGDSFDRLPLPARFGLAEGVFQGVIPASELSADPAGPTIHEALRFSDVAKGEVALGDQRGESHAFLPWRHSTTVGWCS